MDDKELKAYKEALEGAAQVCRMMGNALREKAFTEAEQSRARYADALLTLAAKHILEIEPGLLQPGDKIKI